MKGSRTLLLAAVQGLQGCQVDGDPGDCGRDIEEMKAEERVNQSPKCICAIGNALIGTFM